MQSTPDDSHPASPTGCALQVDGLARRFGRRWALAHVHLALEPGEALMLIGPNGSGKSTLLRCLATAIRPHVGRILVDGRDTWTHRATLRPHIAFLSHAPRLYDDLSATENLTVWARLAGLSAPPTTMLERVGLPNSRPEPVRTFSAGMRRRLALAIALLKRPRLLLLDEPFSALDPDGRATIRDVLQRLRDEGTTMVLATHLGSEAAQCCSKAIHLDAGRVTWRGSSADAVHTGATS